MSSIRSSISRRWLLALCPSWHLQQDKSSNISTVLSITRDVRAAVDLCHRDGSLKRAVAADPGKYIYEVQALL